MNMTNLGRKVSTLAVAVAAVIGVVAGAQAQQFKWNMPTPYADGSFHTKNTRMFAEEIKQATGGRLDITIHSNGSLFKVPEMKRAVQTGQVPIAELNLPAYGNESPFFETEVILFQAQGYEAAARMWKVARPYVEKRLADQGMTVLYTVPFPGMGMISKGSVTKLADMKGTKQRTWGPIATRFSELVGATPTTLQASELSQAFSAGIVDSTLTSSTTGVATQAWDYAKYFIDLEATHSKDTIVVNTKAFQGLPKDIQEAVLKAAATAEKRGWEWAKTEGEETKARLAKEGMIILKPDPAFAAELRKVGDTMAQDWMKRAGPDGVAMFKEYNAK
jgi:TRAP-type C4-dicarboxylate transport system substrate-binding protein